MQRTTWKLVYLVIILCGEEVYSVGKSYEGYKIYEVTPQDEIQSELLYNLFKSHELDLDFLNLVRLPNIPMNVMVPPKDQSVFEEFLIDESIKMRIVNSDVSQTIKKTQRPSSRSDFIMPKFDRYYQHSEINQYLDTLARKHPNITKVEKVGVSFEGRDIKTITISNGVVSANKSVILIDAGIHAREWIAPAAALYIIHKLVEKFEKKKPLLQQYDWVILPLVNPDGYEHSHSKDRMWRRTRSPNFVNDKGRWSGYVFDICSVTHYRLAEGHPEGTIRLMHGYGTDVNRNFESHWGEVNSEQSSTHPCKETYLGPASFSELETQAVRNVMKSLAGRAKMYLSLHSYGSVILYPWGYTSAKPENWKDMHDVAEAGASDIMQRTKRKYEVGAVTEILYANSGNSMDYAKETIGIPITLTMELPYAGTGFDPPPKEIKSLVKETWWGVKAMAIKLQEKYP